jgi:hypothetical protein
MNKQYFPSKPYLNHYFNLFHPNSSDRNKAYSVLIEHFTRDKVDNDTEFQDDLLNVLNETLYDLDNDFNNDDIIEMVREKQHERNGMRVERSGRERSGRERSRSRSRSRSLGGSRTRRRTISSPFLKKMFTARLRLRRSSSKARKARTTRRKY